MKKDASILIMLLCAGILVRLWRITAPLADWHSWRQVDTAGVTREFLKRGIDVLHPRYMDISSIPSGTFNPEGWRMVEFPFVNASVAYVAQFAQGFNIPIDLVVLERLTSILFSTGSAVVLYFIARTFSSKRIALLTAAVFVLVPYNIYYSRAVLPEPKLVFFSLFTTYLFALFLRTGSRRSWIGWVISGALATILKPMWILVFGPALLWLCWRQEKQSRSMKLGISLLLGVILIITPFILWRVWMTQFPSGIPASSWLFNAGGIRFRPAWFRWLFADRLARLILGYWGVFPFLLGIIRKQEINEHYFFHAWLVGGLLYLIVFASGNVTHDYYQVVLIPIISIFTAKGLDALLHPSKQLFSPFVSRALFVVTVVLSLSFAWFHVRDFFNINHPEIVEAGVSADRILPGDARVIAPYGGDTAFLYQINRKGWPVGGAIDDKLSKGATHYVSVNFDEETKWLMVNCLVMLKTSSFVIIDLTRCSEFVYAPS